MTYLGSGIWSYTCWKEAAVQSRLYNVWLRTNLSFQLEESFMPVYQSSNRLVVIQPAFRQLYCSQCCHPADREPSWQCLCFSHFTHWLGCVCVPLVELHFNVCCWWSHCYCYIPPFPSLTFRRAGAILLVNVPATIMTSACRGLALNTTPKRSMS